MDLANEAGVILRRDAVAAGVDDNQLARLVRNGTILRLRQGAYCLKETWDPLDSRGRHLVLTDAVMQQYDDHVALSHDSACLVHGGPDWGLDLSHVHLTHLVGGGRLAAGVVHHEGSCRVLDLTRSSGHWVSSPARTVLDVALLRGVETGVVVADDFLRRGLTTIPELWAVYESMRHWPRAIILRLVIERADGASESVGESRGRLLFWRLGLPKPVLQYEVRHPDGRLVGTADWAWPELGILGEFDGAVKYHRLRRPGETIEQTVMREKRREDTMRELTGYVFLRLVWADLERRARIADRFLELTRQVQRTRRTVGNLVVPG